MQPKIETLQQKKLIGQRVTMSLANNRTGELWKSFMPRRKEINSPLSADLFSLQIYDPGYFAGFNPTIQFEKWAAIEVADFDQVPDGMDTYILPGGLYAVFDYKGSSTDHQIFQYIYGTWLPGSDYDLDDRPHFEVLGSRYKNADPESEEEIWIPVKPKP